MKLLELFKGTGSVGKVFKELYPNGEIYSVDILKSITLPFVGILCLGTTAIPSRSF